MTTKKKAKDDQAGIEDGVLGELLDELEIRQRMAAITRRLPIERKRLYDATIAYRKKKYSTWLKICYLRDDLLDTLEGKSAVLQLKVAIAEGKSKAPIKEDKEALIHMEIGDVMLERELAEMAVKASEQDFEMLHTQLTWYQSVLRNNGPYVPIEQSAAAVYAAGTPDPLPNWKQEEPPVAEPLVELPKIGTPVLKATESASTSTKSDHPVARSIGDLVTAKQLGMIRAISRELGVDADEECMDFLSCHTDELSMRAASSLITHLQEMQQEKTTPAERAAAKSVGSIYGGPKRLSDVRSLDPDVKSEPSTVYTEPDGTKTNDPDSDVPF